ncbi:hypothetical protein GQ55_4G253400 [Panicum hallii var. hallii]|uniref:Uncharacterized protein n=1 Tax=Panicum hallii var. hallii TaxID=1504633 RepID=A0A2T7E023_9POAL|nr:hypothetical protein GQ55_4G253400 [Panicum hallii var. hallii]
MAPGSGHGKSKPREIIPVDQPRLYKCACYRKTIKNTQGHMVNQHKTIKKMKRQNEEHMANKRSKLSMELLPPNEADWSKYCTSKVRLDELVFTTVKSNDDLPRGVESSGLGTEDNGDLDTDKLDLTLKL